MPEERRKGVPGGGVPWAFVLDPAANVRALGDVQRRGLQAARELVGRVVETIDGSDPPPAFGPTNGASPPGSGAGTPLDQLIGVWWELGAQMLATLAAVPGAGSGPSPRSGPSQRSGVPQGTVTVDVIAGAGAIGWHLEAEPDGRLRVPAELWLRNPTPEPVGPLRLTAGALLASDAKLIDARCIRFDPADIGVLPARSARGASVTLSFERPVAPDTYRGVVQAEGAAELCITLAVSVEDRSS